MLYLTFVSLLLPSFILAAPFEIVPVNPALEARQADDCNPTSYTVSEYHYDGSEDKNSAQISFNFLPQFIDPSIISKFDPTGVNCTSTMYNDRESIVTCTGDRTLDFRLGAPNRMQKYQFIHMWVCRK